MKSTYRKIPLAVSIHLRYLYQEQKLSGKELCKRYPMYSQASIYRHAKKLIHDDKHFDGRTLNKGRPRKLSERDRRALLRQIPKLRNTVGFFSTKRLRLAAGTRKDMHD